MTLTVFAPVFATNISPLPLSYASPLGRGPTRIVATTAFVASEMTLTLFAPAFVTNTSPLPLSYATPTGGPSITVATIPVVTAVLIASTVTATDAAGGSEPTSPTPP